MRLLNLVTTRLAAMFFSIAAPSFLSPAPACAQEVDPPARTQSAVLTNSAVAAPNRYGAMTAERIFRAGGNAIDAAAAIAFTLAVTYPEAGNLGGGGFMTIYMQGKPYFLDYRERAPNAATPDMYLDQQGNIIPGLSLYGYRAVGVPGTVAGIWAAQRRFGNLKWKQVIAPAIGYARDGFNISNQLARRSAAASTIFADKTNYNRYFGALKAGKNFKQPELAAVLSRIANNGAKEFYEGKTADLLVAAMKRGNGLITKQDLRQYQAIWREPIQAEWNGYRVITAPPPSSGGIGLVQLLKMKAARHTDFSGVPLNSAQYVHLIAELEKRVFADRARYLGDPDFYPVPVERLISNAYLTQRAAEINPRTPSATQDIQPGLTSLLPEKMETTHFSTLDRWGNAVANTYTLNGNFGAGVIAEGTGIVLNDEMDDFSAKPGVANMFGVTGGKANAIEPGKRPLSSMAPTILTQDGKVALVIGTPGGSRIFTSIFQVITNLYDFNMPLEKAVSAWRFHHQLLPANTIFLEPYHGPEPSVAQALETRGYALQKQDFNGDIQAIQINGPKPDPIADPRGCGIARLSR